MKSENFFVRVLIVQCAVYFSYYVARTLPEVLSGKKSDFDLVQWLFLPLIFSYILYDLIFKVKKIKFEKYWIAATALLTLTAMLLFGISSYLSGGITWDIASVGMVSIALLGIGAFLYYFFIRRRNTE